MKKNASELLAAVDNAAEELRRAKAWAMSLYDTVNGSEQGRKWRQECPREYAVWQYYVRQAVAEREQALRAARIALEWGEVTA